MARRRSRRRKSSYSEEVDSNGLPPQLVVEDLSPRARRLAESGVIDVAAITGSGEGGRITSGDILHAARVMEVEQSVARIETVGHDTEKSESAGEPEQITTPEPAVQSEMVIAPEPVVVSDTEIAPEAILAPDSPVPEEPTFDPDSSVPAEPAFTAEPMIEPDDVVTNDEGPDLDAETEDSHAVADTAAPVPSLSDATTSSASDIGSDVIEVPPSPWDAYNGSSDGLAESALPGAEQSWGEAEANIAAIAEEAAAQVYGRTPVSSEPGAVIEPEPSPAFEPEEPTADQETIAEPIAVEEPTVEMPGELAPVDDVGAADDGAESPVEEPAAVEPPITEVPELVPWKQNLN